MVAVASGCVVLLLLFVQKSCSYSIPEIQIEALKPKGFRASIPNDPSITIFAFNGNINRPISNTDVGTIHIEVTASKDGRWIAEDNRLELKVGDVINYYVFVAAARAGHLKDNQSYNVTALVDPYGTPTIASRIPGCKPTATKVRGGSACAGQVIFEDNFSSFRDDVWQIEQYIPDFSSEFPFVSYQNRVSDPTVSIDNGNLVIKTKMQHQQPGFDENSIFTGTLDLFSGCTAEACSKTGVGAFILPPIISGKVTSKGFAFTYGTVYIRAKLPKGDWLYPDILLEPFLKKYGAMHYSSGVLKIASARGNEDLKYRSTDYSNKVLFGGPIMNYDCLDMLLKTKQAPEPQQWSDDYHVYAVRWEPEKITLLVDDVEWATIEPSSEGLQGKFPARCAHLPRTYLSKGGHMAPFDDHFYITLGLSVGGITEFPDNVTSGGKDKPWTNSGRKALLSFWGHRDDWLPTWTEPQLLVDYVKVVAL